MYRTLVVPLDGSELAERALPYAVRLVRATGGRVVLVRVVCPPSPPTLESFGWEHVVEVALQDAATYLDETRAQLAGSVPVETVLTTGSAAEEIVQVVAQCAADGIVMATHGRTGLVHLVRGSVAEGVLARSPVPVCLVHVRPGTGMAAPFDPTSARLLVPVDGSSFAATAIQSAVDLLGSAGELVLVRVVEPPDQVLHDVEGGVVAFLDEQHAELKSRTRAYLDRLARRLRAEHPGMHVSTEVRIGRPAKGIIGTALDRGADLVVMASHGRTGLERAIIGSVAGDVLRGGTTPVLMVHPDRQSAASAVPAIAGVS